MTALSMSRVRAAWESVLPNRYACDDGGRVRIERTDRVVLAGCLHELCSPTPSGVELAAVLEVAHSTALVMLDNWQAMRWDARFAWLSLVHRRALEDLQNQPRGP